MKLHHSAVANAPGPATSAATSTSASSSASLYSHSSSNSSHLHHLGVDIMPPGEFRYDSEFGLRKILIGSGHTGPTKARSVWGILSARNAPAQTCTVSLCVGQPAPPRTRAVQAHMCSAAEAGGSRRRRPKHNVRPMVRPCALCPTTRCNQVCAAASSSAAAVVNLVEGGSESY